MVLRVISSRDDVDKTRSILEHMERELTRNTITFYSNLNTETSFYGEVRKVFGEKTGPTNEGRWRDYKVKVYI